MGGLKCHAGKTQKNILVIHSYHIGYAWTDSINSGLLSVLNNVENMNVYIEHLDGKRYEDSSYFRQLYQIYQQKYKNRVFDLVILSDNLALDFSLLHGNSLYRNTPVVYCGVSNPETYNLSDLPYYGVLETLAEEKVLVQIIEMFPKIENLYLISDKTQLGIETQSRYIEFTKRMSSEIKFHFIDNIVIDSLHLNIKKIKKSDAVILLSLQRDKTGEPLNYEHETSQLCSICPAPVFCNYFSILGEGILGGCSVNAYSQGKLSAEIALNILFTPDFKPKKLEVPPMEFYFDFNVMKRFNIRSTMLPPDSKIINQPENVYEKYKRQILLTIAFIAFLIVTIIWMLINSVKRKRAELLVWKKNIEIQRQNKEIEAQNEEYLQLNEELLQSNEELNKAKERAEESDRLKTAFLQNMNHEIRTPMNAIMGFSELLAANFENKQKLEKFSAIISQRCSDLLIIVDDILDISRIESGLLPLCIEYFNVEELLNELSVFFEEYQKRIGKEHIAFCLKYTGDPAHSIIATDKEKLKKVLINLISNAFKYTETGSIDVGCRFDENHKLTFSVSDTGIGIPADKQKLIFERFSQLNPGANKVVSGTGLGLAIVTGLLKLIDGEIVLTSEPGKGSTFTFSFQPQSKTFRTNNSILPKQENEPS
jgi:signal transduction histidine kinase